MHINIIPWQIALSQTNYYKLPYYICMIGVKNKFSIRLKELRELKGLSQSILATKLGYTQPCIGKWEAGTREPSLDDIIAIALFFNVTTDYLLGVTDL